jgi:hypothetical protein
VKPSVNDFMNTPSQFRTAFSAATALFHMHEWLYEFNQAQLEQKYSQTFATKGALWAHVESLVPTSGFIRDLAGRYGGRNVKMKDGATEVSLDDCVRAGVCCRQGGLHSTRRLWPSFAPPGHRRRRRHDLKAVAAVPAALGIAGSGPRYPPYPNGLIGLETTFHANRESVLVGQGQLDRLDDQRPGERQMTEPPPRGLPAAALLIMYTSQEA